jgi:hypothetical protein
LEPDVILGLYGHSCATAAFFLVIAAYFWLMRAPSFRRALVLAGALVLTFLCHASRFIMAVAGVGTIAATNLVMRRERIFLPQRYAFAAMMASLPLAALFLSGAKGAV